MLFRSCFGLLLNHFGIVTSPGVGFGAQGEGWLRLSSFGSRDMIEQAAHKLSAMDWDQLALWAPDSLHAHNTQK